jgi:haloalkane dehalogenase
MAGVENLAFDVPQDLFPVRHRFVEVDGARIHYVDEGQGETLLLLHGNPSWSFLYRKIIAGLKDRYRCIALDFPGYGLSDAASGYRFSPREHSRLLEHFVDHLSLKDIGVMVQDWGGPIGLGLAGRRPDLVTWFVIGNTFAWPLNSLPRLRVFSWLMGGPVGVSLTYAFNFVPRAFFFRGFAQKPAPQIFSLYMAPWKSRKRRIAAVIAPRQLTSASDYLVEVERNLPKLARRPALIVWGLKDLAFRETERRHFEQLFPTHKTILFEDASHFLQEDVGDRIAAAIKDFNRG